MKKKLGEIEEFRMRLFCVRGLKKILSCSASGLRVRRMQSMCKRIGGVNKTIHHNLMAPFSNFDGNIHYGSKH